LLIHDTKARNKRAKEKERIILDWLRDEVFSTSDILASVLGVQRRAVQMLLAKLEKRELVSRGLIEFPGTRGVHLWGITSKGILHDIDPQRIASISLRYFSPAKIKATQLLHTLDTQRLKQAAFSQGLVKDWSPDRLLPGKGGKKGDKDKWQHYPDAVALAHSNNIDYSVAIEVERTRKTPRRYIDIIKKHFLNMNKQRYYRVWYYCPTRKEADSLKALFLRIMKDGNLRYSDTNVNYSVEDSLKLFKFRSMEKI